MSEARSKKVLRVGVVQGGRIVEERILRKAARISIGQSPRNTFAIPVAQLPASYVLFDVKNGAYQLRFVRGMDGLVSVDGDVVHLRDLVDRKLASQQGKHYLYTLNETGRGKVVLGEVTLLFQFVDPPPPVSRLQLPAMVKESWWKRIDGFFALILLLSFLVQGGSVGVLEYWWLTSGQFEQKVRPKKALIDALRVEVQKEDESEEKKTLSEDLLAVADANVAAPEDAFEEDAGLEDEDDLIERKPAAEPGADKALSPEEEKARRYERQLSRVREATLVKHILSRGAGPEGSQYRDALSEGATGAKLSDAWREKGGVAVASPGEGGMFRGEPKAAEEEGAGYKTISKKGRYGGAIETGKVEGGGKGPEVKVRARIGGELGKKSGIGAIDEQSVAGVFRRRRSAVKRCYEQALRANPDAQGKVVIQFTIGPAGRITSISVQSDSTGEPSIAQCIVARVQGWRFDPPERGSVTFSYPFILSRG